MEKPVSKYFRVSELRKKRVSESRTEQIQIVMPGDINGNGRLFGGRLIEWIDVVAAVVARRHSGHEVTTVSIDNLHFKAPAYVNDTVVLIGCATYTGRTSIEVRVDTYAETLRGERSMINRAYVVMVAIDEDEKPTPVPSLLLEDDEQRAEWEAGEKRREFIKRRRYEGF
ncbi:MAG: acyl-CoA thioesterase [Oscillospiraceae bacterium]|nr:acyl-CoA thioesterase [Oscillospiraceae bacterium]